MSVHTYYDYAYGCKKMPWGSQFPFSGKAQTKFILYTVVYVPTRPALGLRLAFEPKGMSSSHQDLSPGESREISTILMAQALMFLTSKIGH